MQDANKKPEGNATKASPMTTSRAVGSMTRSWRFPLKSMRGERIEESAVAETGLVGDSPSTLFAR